VPLRHHFDKNLHFRHRLDQYGAGRCLEYDAVAPELFADAVVEELGRETGYRTVESDRADRAADLIADLLNAIPAPRSGPCVTFTAEQRDHVLNELVHHFGAHTSVEGSHARRRRPCQPDCDHPDQTEREAE
jgi:hypothetical protein